MTTDNKLPYIMGHLVPTWQDFYQLKNKDYAGSGSEFGVRGEVHNLGKKMMKIKRALWDGEPLVGEQPREILLDMIGHCFQALAELDQAEHQAAWMAPRITWVDPEYMEGDGDEQFFKRFGIASERQPWEDPNRPGIAIDNFGGSTSAYLSAPHGPAPIRPCMEQSDCDCFFMRAEGDTPPVPCPRSQAAEKLRG